MKLDRFSAPLVLGFPLFSGNKLSRLGFLLACLAWSSCSDREPVAAFSTPAGPKRVLLELAETEAERGRGLMFRTRLDEDRGMLFVFPDTGRPAFWMKNTYLALDILFLSSEGVVVDLFERLPPCPMDPCPRYTPHAPSSYVLEVSGGFVDRYAVRKGDRIRFENVPGVPSP